ncbi:uncharacterized protein LOC129258777 [Lytechinus pictus]|uniref:uncharacterized protein LOC129258777 n=1 Tax=Lytechinus pictus TaxID=7653 RepID=UPI0030B9CDE1
MPVSPSVWRARIGTYMRRKQKVYDYFYYLRRYVYGLKLIEKAKKAAEHSKENDNSNCHHSSSNSSSTGENGKSRNSSCRQHPPSDSVNLKPAETESPGDRDVNSKEVEASSQTGYVGGNGPSCHTKSPDHIAQDGSKCADGRTLATHPTSSTEMRSTPVPNPSDTKPTKPCDLDELDLRYITIHRESHANLHNSTQIREQDQGGGTSEVYSQVATHIAGHQDGDKQDKEISNPLTSEIDIQSLPVSQLDKSNNAEHTLCTREIAELCGAPISSVSRSRSPSSGSDETQMNSFSSGMTNVLLLRSGDVEKNPGPNTHPGNLTEFELHLLADGMDPLDFRKVGLALGFTEAQLSRFKEDNIGNIMQAIYKMLCEWLKTVKQVEAREILSNKLKDINMVQLADSVQKGKAGDHIPSMTEDEFQRVIIEVKKYSAIHHCQIQADPLNSRLILEFKRIFTNLTLMEEDKGTEHKTPLLYEDLLNTKVNGVFPQRLLVEGEGGVGKTTLCAKIVWDWIHGAGYQDFKLVLLVLLREVKDKTIGEIIKSYLPDDNMVTAMQLNKYVFSHQKDVLLALDGFDELAGDLDSCYQITLIILNRVFKSGKVLITSRRWRSDEIRNITELRKLYAFIAVEGFSDENLSSYVTKFFHPDTTSAEDLNRFISNNDVIRENMAPYPIYTAMLCIMWKEFDGERRIAMSKLQTFSQLIDEMVQFLVDHYLSKLGLTSRDEEWHVQRAEILLHLSKIGCLAFQGLMERRLVFTEQEFKSWPGCVNAGCQVGVLTKQAPIIQRRQQRYHAHPTDSSLQFPHKLFQEYLSGMYLASLHNSNRREYDRLMKAIMNNIWEFKELLYFTSAQQKEVGLDIVSHPKASSEGDFIVDVAYESQDQTVCKAVADHLSTSSSNTFVINEWMKAHTVSGHIFIMNHRKVEKLVIKKPCGRTASEDLAEFMCSSNTLRSVTIHMPKSRADAHMHDVFYSVLARNATDTKIERLDINYIDLSQRQSASRDLAQFICKMPHLRELILGSYENSPKFHDEFYSTLSSLASSAKIETIHHHENLSESPSASRDFAQFICKMNHLKNLTLYGQYHDDFYSTASSMTSTTKIEILDLRENLSERPSASRDFAQFICKMNHLKNLKLYSQYHDDFYSTASSMASTAKIEILHHNDDLRQRPSASRDLAQFICKINHLKNLTLDGYYHDDFYSTASSMASTTKIETLHHNDDLSERPSALRDLAQFICKMNHLKNLTLDGYYHDDFYSTAASMASTAKIERLDIERVGLSQRQPSSRDLAQFICKMPHLRELRLGGGYYSLSSHDEFFSTLSSLASSAKIEILDLRENLSERPSASRDFAQFICKMNHMKNLKLYSQYHDDFYSTASSMASTTKIETLHHNDDLSERPSASHDLAQFICKMNHLKDLTLYGQYHDDFYSTASSMASTTKIETLHLEDYLSPSASRDLAQFICKMNHLKDLTLYGQYHDDFYSTASSMASTTKIEILHHNDDLSERPSASRDLAQFICKMNYLKTLKLDGLYHDDFYSTSSSMASTAKIELLDITRVGLSQRQPASRDLAQFFCKMPHLRELRLGDLYYSSSFHDEFYSTLSSLASCAKIETLHHEDCLTQRPSASRDLAQFICKMNHLKNLTLYSQYHDDFYSTSSSMALSTKDECNTSSNVTDLTITNMTLDGWQDCGSMFDNVKRITIQVLDTIRCDVIQRIHLPAVTELTVQTHEHLNIGNDKTERIIQAFRSIPDLKHLRILRFIRCGTDERLDRSSIDSDDEHNITVEMVHGKRVGNLF